DEGRDELAEQADGGKAEHAEQRAAEDRSEHADDEVAGETEAFALGEQAAEPAGDEADDEQGEQGFEGHGRKRASSFCHKATGICSARAPAPRPAASSSAIQAAPLPGRRERSKAPTCLRRC